MCPDAPRQDPEPPKESAVEPQLAHPQEHPGSPCGEFRESVSSRKQSCLWMHSQAPAAQEDTCPPAKQGPPAHTCHTSPGDLQPCTEPPRPHSAWAPTQPLRMVFTRWTEVAGAPGSSQLPHSFLPRSQALFRALLPPTCQTEPVSVAPGVSSTVTYRCPHPQKTLRANEPAPSLGHCPPPHCILTG